MIRVKSSFFSEAFGKQEVLSVLWVPAASSIVTVAFFPIVIGE